MRKRISVADRDAHVLVPFPTHSFLISADESLVAYTARGGGLYLYRPEHDDEPHHLPTTLRTASTENVAISPDNRRIAFLEAVHDEPASGPYQHLWRIRAFDGETGDVATVGTLPEAPAPGAIAWSADGDDILATCRETRDVFVFTARPPFGLRHRRQEPPSLDELAVVYGRENSGVLGGGHYRVGEYKVLCSPWTIDGIRVMRDDELVFAISHWYSRLSPHMYAPIMGAIPLPNGDEMLVDWGTRTYLLDISARKLGLAADGHGAVLRTSHFRARLAEPHDDDSAIVN